MRAKLKDLTVLNLIILSFTFIPLGGILGFFSSLVIHTTSPQYYALVFDLPTNKGYAVGIGTGISQGLGAGVALAAAFIIAVAIAQREQSPSFSPPPTNPPK